MGGCSGESSSHPVSLAALGMPFGSPVAALDVTTLAIRQYEPRDAEAVWDLHERALRDVGAYDEAYAHLDRDLRTITELFLDVGGEFLVGEVDDTVVAMGALQPATVVDHHEGGPATGVVRRMRVDPTHQRRGYGRTILSELEDRAVDLGFKRLVLDTTPRQTAARGLYEDFGYEERRREPTATGKLIVYGKSLD